MSEVSDTHDDTDRPLPLAGITVLDLGQIYQGPYAGFLLAMAGARVIKVEQTLGEPLRARGNSLPFAMLNSSKESVTLNLKSPEGHEMFLGLAQNADVVLVNFAPGVPEKLKIDADSLWKINPRLVFAHASGFGLSGPSADQTAMDITVQAHMGSMSVTGHPGELPVKAGVPFVDFLGGSHLYGGIVTALFEVQRTGRGRMVETSMAEAAYHTLSTNMLSWHQSGATQRTGNKHAALGMAPYDLYECQDGHIALIAVTNRHWRSVLSVIGREDLISDSRYTENSDRALHMGEVDQLVGSWTRRHSREEANQLLSDAGVPVAIVREVSEVVTDKHLTQRGFIEWLEHEELGSIPVPHSPIRWTGSPLRPLELFHDLGADNSKIFSEMLGLSEEQLQDLKKRKII